MIEVFSAEGESRSCEIIAIASIPYNISIQHTHPVDINIFIPSDVFLEKVEQKCPMLVTLDVEDSQIDTMENFIANFANTSITSIMARKRELAVLESIGMTVKQQRSMPVFLILAIMIPVVSQMYVSRESVVERLRMAE